MLSFLPYLVVIFLPLMSLRATPGSSLAGTSNSSSSSSRWHWFDPNLRAALLAASYLFCCAFPCQASTFPPPPSSTVPPLRSTYRSAILFPTAQSTVVPDPSRFFAPNLLDSPLPTNSFFQNFVLKEGNQTEYIHPYLIRSSKDGLTMSYPTRNHSAAVITQIFTPDLTVSASRGNTSSSSSQSHVISGFDDLSVTLDFPPALRFYLVRGSPYVTGSTLQPTRISLTSPHGLLVTSDTAKTKHRIQLKSTGQTFLCYSSAPLVLAQAGSTRIESDSIFSGVLRLALLLDPSHEPVLDLFSPRYPVSGSAEFTGPFQVEYRWRKKGHGDSRRLLLLAHPLHLRLLDRSRIQLLDRFRYRSIDGDLVGVVAESWTLKSDPVPITWHSIGGLDDGKEELVSALRADVKNLSSNPISTTASYFYGKAVARAARMALIAEEAGVQDAIRPAVEFVKKSTEPWLNGSFKGNAFLYDPKWRGFVTRQGSTDPAGDFGFGIYNDHHFHLGYFLYGVAVASKLDRSWGRKYRPQAYAMVADILTRSRNKPGTPYTRLRCFDLWKLHSWAAGLTEFADGRNQESTSEAVNAYYSAALLGLSFGDAHLTSLASTLTALEISAAQTWWHVRKDGSSIYEEEYRESNRVVGVLWNNKRDTGLWFAPAAWRECRMGIQILPLSPITEVLFPDADFVRDLVDWTTPALSRKGVGEGWKGFVYAMEGVYDREGALEKTRALKGHDDGNSLTNLLWWLYSRKTASQ